jgi:hypothetical protein
VVSGSLSSEQHTNQDAFGLAGVPLDLVEKFRHENSPVDEDVESINYLAVDGSGTTRLRLALKVPPMF